MKIQRRRASVILSSLLAACGVAWAIPGYHVSDQASVNRAVHEYADDSFSFRAVVYQALLDKNTWQLALAAHEYLMQKPTSPERECSFAEAYWQTQQISAPENVPPSARKQLQQLYDEAVRDTKDAAIKNPASVAVHLNYGSYLQYFVPGMGKVPLMQHEFEKAVALRPDLADTHYRLSMAYFGSGDYSKKNCDRTVREAKRALALNPRLIDSYNLIIGAYYTVKDWRMVKTYLDKYVSVNPGAADRPDVRAAYKTARENLP